MHHLCYIASPAGNQSSHDSKIGHVFLRLFWNGAMHQDKNGVYMRRSCVSIVVSVLSRPGNQSTKGIPSLAASILLTLDQSDFTFETLFPLQLTRQ